MFELRFARNTDRSIRGIHAALRGLSPAMLAVVGLPPGKMTPDKSLDVLAHALDIATLLPTDTARSIAW